MNPLDLLGGQRPDFISGRFGLDPLQQSMDQFAQRPRGIMGALQGLGGNINSVLGKADPMSLGLIAASLLANSGPTQRKTSFGERLGGALSQSLPQVANQQSIKERTELAKQDVMMRKAEHELSMKGAKAVQDQALTFLKAAIPGDADQNGILDANEQAALPYVRQAALTGDSQYWAKAIEKLNPDATEAPKTFEMKLPDGRLQTYQWLNGKWEAWGEPGAKTPDTQVNINNTKPPNGYMWNDPSGDPTKGVSPIPGGPAVDRTPEQAAKEQMYATAQEQIPKIQAMLFDPEGNVNRANVTTSAAIRGGIPGTEGAELSAMYETGIQALTRGETGAAMPPSEVANTRQRFQPRLIDSDEVVKIKWEMYQDMINGGLKLIRMGKGGTPEFDAAGFDKELAKRTATSTPQAAPQRMINPQTGQVIVLKDGQWQPE